MTPGQRRTDRGPTGEDPRTYDRLMTGVRTPLLEVGARVEVRSGFDDSWQRGFVVEEVTDDGYLLCRDTDRSILPEIPRERVRRERKRETWWV